MKSELDIYKILNKTKDEKIKLHKRMDSVLILKETPQIEIDKIQSEMNSCDDRIKLLEEILEI